MSDPLQSPKLAPEDDQEPESKGPNLFVLYALLALALLAAAAFAAMVVWPFYLRR
jgi:hypothetical protein